MSEKSHLLIADVAQDLLRPDSAALCVHRKAGALISAEQQEFCGLIHHHDPGGGLDRITAVFVAQSWTGEPYNAEPDKHERLLWVPMERPSPDCHPYTATIFHMLTHGPSYRAINWPAGGAR
ncbi:NUDIX hydrolase [Streptomyces flaveolus]|uniref:NUDIX hydrolase n=1 Tax=Streptomyces flaveolus TaxID=67297 RepID=UPI0033243466